ncbi:A-kinase anchor protein 1, mitochondrial [Drosophila sulfurigaster albostrigata]|uniref:A-kinase anchor protein 1, mitochondrial n=1 Tax=Drosophila sulfurigaster albostrigata TaxID=89887 RepID=UPI002D21DF8D|nr:A-kinase anchor protein 1, mitochondrial [Drosophila sulfurigaster albostrigata]
MVSGRPLLYLSLPGVAFILGVFWFRRRNKNRVDKNDDDNGTAAVANGKPVKEAAAEPAIQQRKVNGVQSANGKLPNGSVATKSMNITVGGNSGSGGGGNVDDKDSPNSMLYGKSAPITIQQSNGRASPGNKHQQQQQQIDSEMLKSKIQDAEHKKLCSIDEDFENLSSPSNLPDSVNNRVSFYNRKTNQKAEEPVVIKATRTPKISPENSFLESKYTKQECGEQNNNCEPTKKQEAATTAASPIETATATETQIQATEKQTEDDQNQNQNENQNSVVVEQTIVSSSSEADDANGNQKRNVDAASPSLSICSVQSGDSGKGSSLPRSEATTRIKTTYEFYFPNSLIGQLYGRKRSFINQMKAKTSANVTLSKTRYSTGKLRICTIEGTETEIDAALVMIRQRLPARRYPNFTMQRIHYALPQTVVPLSTESLFNLQLKLIEGINNDVVVTAVLSGNHVFVQHPLHPSHPSLHALQKGMFDSYSTMEAPTLPSIEISAVCVIPVNGVWYRVQICDIDEEDEERCLVKFLDFGGYMNVSFSALRQIRTDFMALPFQATECILSNVEPIDNTWSADAADILNKLTKGIVLQAQVAGYNSHNIPEIYLFASLGPNNVIFINKELVARNLAKWVEIRD